MRNFADLGMELSEQPQALPFLKILAQRPGW
jgi:hypothetical protein